MRTHTKRKGRRFISIAIALVMLLALTLGAAPGMAANNDPVRVVWEAAGIDETITHENRVAMDKTVGPFSYASTNTMGSLTNATGVEGIKISDLLEYAGINSNTLEPNRIITFVASDNPNFSNSFLWGQLSDTRYHYTYPGGTSNYAAFRAGVRGDEVPAIISFNQGTPSPRIFIGINYPEEQFRGASTQQIGTIRVGGLAGKWNAPYVFIEDPGSSNGGTGTAIANGATVEAGMKLRITNDTYGQSGSSHKYFYTTDGSDPVPGNPNTTMFNFNSNSPSIAANPSIVVPPGTGKFVIKAITYGYGLRTSDVATYTFNYPYEEKVAFLTGPDEVHVDAGELEYKVNVANIEDINMFEITMSYDADKLSFDESNVLLPTSLSGWVLDEVDNATAGELKLVVTAGTSGAALMVAANDKAEVAGLKFLIDSGVTAGDVIEAELLKVTLYDPVAGDDDGATIVGGIVSTLVVAGDPLLKYDINGDGVYDLLDLAIIIYKYFMVNDTEPLWSEAQVYNIVKSGTAQVINTADIIALYSLIVG